MGLDDLMSAESAVVATVTAAVFSPKTRETLRKGAVMGVAGALKAGDVVTGAARGVVRGVKGEEEMPTPSTNGGASGQTRTRSTSSRKATATARPRRSSASRSTRSAGSGGSRASSSGGSATT